MKLLSQFKCTIDCLYAKEFIQKVCELMNIQFDSEKYLKASHNKDDKLNGWYDVGDPRQVCIFYNPHQKERFVFIECAMAGFWGIAVQCMEEEKHLVQKEYTKLFKEVLIKDGQNPGDWNLPDVYDTEEDIYLSAVKKYKVDFFVV